MASPRPGIVHPSKARVWSLIVSFALACTVAAAADRVGLKLERASEGMLIGPELFAEAGIADDGKNINGPSLIRIPASIPATRRAHPDAQYYLYFAHHNGRYIRLAWAAKIAGPYTLFRPGVGVLSLNQPPAVPAGEPGNRLIAVSATSAVGGHIASPDMHFDARLGRFVMIFHGWSFHRTQTGESWRRDRSEQKSFVALSADGLDFSRELGPEVLERSYLRVFEWAGQRYASAFDGFYRSRDPGNWFAPYERLPASFSALARARHTALRRNGNRLDVFYTETGEAPEHLRVARLELGPEPRDWRLREDQPLLVPEAAWEGGSLPVIPSLPGPAHRPENAFRDPAYFRDEDGCEYLLYSVQGERGIALARIVDLANAGP